MMTEEEFLEAVKKSGFDVVGLDAEWENFDSLAKAALKVREKMPGNGFFSVYGRINCFMSVCRHLDTMIEDGDLNLSGSQIVLIILRLKDRKFRKAIGMFDLRWPRYGVGERAEMPRPAIEYLAGLEL